MLRFFLLTSSTSMSALKESLEFYGLGLGPEGERYPIRIVFSDQKPVFFVLRESRFDRRQVGAFERKEVGLKSFDQSDVDALYFENSERQKKGRETLEDLGVRTFEADVRAHERFLMERFIYGEVLLPLDLKHADLQKLITLENPEFQVPSDVFPSVPPFYMLSLDIETGQNGELYSVAFHGLNTQTSEKLLAKVIMLDDREMEKVEGHTSPLEECDYQVVESEKRLLQETINLINDFDPDILIGWHVIGFDLKFLERKCYQHGMTLQIARTDRPIEIIERKGVGFFAECEGRVVIDGPQALRSAFYQFESFKLDNVAHELLGEGKDISSSGEQKVQEIERRFREDKHSLALYNFLDTELVSKIFLKTKLIDHLWRRVQYSGLMLNRLGVSTSAFDFFFLPKLHRKGFVAPNVLDIKRTEHTSGGHVISSQIGLHEHVVVLDFTSLYPSLIRTFHIDPYSRLVIDRDPLRNPSGIFFSRKEHLLAERISRLMKLREKAQSKGDQSLSQALKILMNSFYGIMGSTRSRFYHADLPRAITDSARWCLEKTTSFLESEGYQVIYGDTDSVFVKLKDLERMRPFEKTERILTKVNQYFKELVEREFQTESFLHLKLDKYYRKIFFSPLRNTSSIGDDSEVSGAKKRYVGLLKKPSGDEELNFVGMEFIRSDWTKLAKSFQYQLFSKFFDDENIEDFIKKTVDQLKAGEFDEFLIYEKRLSKRPWEYSKSIPVHVKAALLLTREEQERVRTISYIMTRRGPRPLSFGDSDFDYQHYIDKQIRPLAQVVLQVKEIQFDDLITGDQLSFF